MPDKMERFTVRSRNVLSLSQDEAARRNHAIIDTEHLLLGLMRAQGGIARRVLQNHGLELERVEALVEELAPASPPRNLDHLDVSPQVKELLTLSVDEARRMGVHYIGTEHLLLGMVRQSNTKAVQILKRADIEPDEVRHEVRHMLQVSTGDTPPDQTGTEAYPSRQNDVFGGFSRISRFNGSACSVLNWAKIEAEQLNCHLIGAEHLLLGLLRGENPTAEAVLNEAGVTYEKVKQCWQQTPALPEPREMELSEPCKQVLEWAVDEGDQLGHRSIGSEHLLLGLLRLPEGEVVNLFNCLGVSRQQVLEETRQAVKQLRYYEPSAPLPPGRFIRFINRVFKLKL